MVLLYEAVFNRLPVNIILCTLIGFLCLHTTSNLLANCTAVVAPIFELKYVKLLL